MSQNFTGSSSLAASALTGTVLASNVVTSSLTTIGTLVAGAVPASLVTAGQFGAGDYTFPGDLTVSGTGPHAIGGAVNGRFGFFIQGNYLSDGGTNSAAGTFIAQALTGASGDTGHLTGLRIAGSITTQTATETIASISSVRIEEPQITDNLTGDITIAATVHILNAPTEGEDNYALWVDAGNTRLDGVLLQSTVTTLANDATPTVAAGNLFITGGTTAITDFDDGIVGQTITILAAHSITITDGAPIILAGGANYGMTDSDTLTLTMFNDQVWNEIARSVN